MVKTTIGIVNPVVQKHKIFTDKLRAKCVIFLLLLIISYPAVAQISVTQYDVTSISTNNGGKCISVELGASIDSNGNHIRKIASYISKKWYYENGKLQKEYLIDGEFISGSYLSYFKNGNIDEFYFCFKGHKVGAYMKFYEDKKKMIFGEYSLPEKVPDYYEVSDTLKDQNIVVYTQIFNDIKEGKWFYWNEKGELIKTETWEKGKLIR
jgi:hypothetical protein